MNKSLLLTACVFILLFSGCDRTRLDKGREYFPDMAHSLAYETYTGNEVFKDGQTVRKPVEGTVPRGMIPYPYPATFEGRDKAGKTLKNPVELNATALSEGKKQYEIFCINCHGSQGDGNGYLYTSKKYIVKPKSLITDQMKTTPGGEIYHVITMGQGVMGAHGPQIEPENRWKIVHYIQQQLQK